MTEARHPRIVCRTLIPIVLALTPLPVEAQPVVDAERAVIKVAASLRGLGVVKRVLVIGAHPDDEDTGLLTLLERGYGADAAYLALSRGEGGQNLIGPELGVGLGAVRTGELLAARRLDGAEQFFTRAYDFGYSKSAEETFALWPKDSLLADVVMVIRRFRPQVVVSVFSGTSRDGHGQHRVAGILAREAFAAAGDPSRFPAQIAAGLQAWQPRKLYRSTRFDRDATTLALETGRLDPLYGRSYHQIAMASRSQHRSQDMGRIQGLGPRLTRVQLLQSRVGPVPADETSLFDGVDTTLVGLLDAVPESGARAELERQLASYDARLEEARRSLTPWALERSAPVLAEALGSLRAAREAAERMGAGAAHTRFLLAEEEAKLEEALLAASGIVVEAFADDDLLVAGQRLDIEVQVWNGGERALEIESVVLKTPAGRLPASGGSSPRRVVDGGQLAAIERTVSIPPGTPLSRPYFLQRDFEKRPPQPMIYDWSGDVTMLGRALGPPLARAEVELTVHDRRVRRDVEVVHRFADQARGEIRRPLHVVPAIGVDIAPATSVWPLGRQEPLVFTVRLRSEDPDAVEGSLRLEAPAGWSVRPEQGGFVLREPGAVTSVEFMATPTNGLTAGAHAFRAVAETADGRRFDVGYDLVDYPHIRTEVLYRESSARVRAFELNLPDRPLAVAFVPGTGSVAAQAMRALGVGVRVLDSRATADADLSEFDVIVLGVRAYETNRALVENNERFLDWAREGGTLIVQYQQYTFFNGDYAPYPMEARFPHDRVTDETAEVRLLDPEHRVFHSPNRIGDADFEGWVQERGLYFPYRWDERYEPLLEMSDPGEPAKRGALLIAPLDAGLYVYTGLALFRQFPAGIPGAYRLLVNLLDLDRGQAF